MHLKTLHLAAALFFIATAASEVWNLVELILGMPVSKVQQGCAFAMAGIAVSVLAVESWVNRNAHL